MSFFLGILYVLLLDLLEDLFVDEDDLNELLEEGLGEDLKLLDDDPMLDLGELEKLLAETSVKKEKTKIIVRTRK
ncbi:hypothetical protein QO179_23650 [Bacillus stercoris]|nr:hypothetical protein [Bacillus stercoris]